MPNSFSYVSPGSIPRFRVQILSCIPVFFML